MLDFSVLLNDLKLVYEGETRSNEQRHSYDADAVDDSQRVQAANVYRRLTDRGNGA